MHLAVDAVGVKHSGGATVLLDFLDGAIADDRVSKVTLFCSPRPSRAFDLPGSAKIVVREQPRAERNKLYRFWWFERALPAEVERAAADALLCMSWGGKAPRGVPQITFVQQSLLFSPEASRRFGVVGQASIALVRFETARACRSSRAVFVQTPTMKRWVSSGFGISADRVMAFIPSVTPPARAPERSPQLEAMRAAPEGRRLLYVGNHMPYKNLEIIARSMRLMRASLPGATLFVTLPPDHPLARLEGVVGCGYLSRSALREAYELATVLVMPSLVETVGLPMLESMSVGTPVLAADRPYARDVCEDAAMYFDPADEESFALVATELLLDTSRVEGLRARGLAISRERTADQPYRRMVDEIVRMASVGRSEQDLSGRGPTR